MFLIQYALIKPIYNFKHSSFNHTALLIIVLDLQTHIGLICFLHIYNLFLNYIFFCFINCILNFFVFKCNNLFFKFYNLFFEFLTLKIFVEFYIGLFKGTFLN